MTIASKLKQLSERYGSVASLSDALKIKRTTMYGWVNGSTEPRASDILLIVKETGASADWLIGSEASSTLTLRTTTEDSVLVGSMLAVPRYDIQASAGAGRLVVSEHRNGWMAVDRDWLSRYVSRAAQVGVIEAVGDSMSPTIRNRDLLLVEVRDGFTAQDLMRGGVYVLTLDGGLVVKRLSIDGDTLIVGSDNPAHAEIRVPFAQIEDRAKIHGIVFWSGGALETHR